jgi:uncharacterized protein with PIN domain
VAELSSLAMADLADDPRFLCDAMLGSLARWLRFCGYDTLYLGTEPEDAELARIAERDGRWLLTRDRELASAGPRTQMVRAEALEAQLAEVLLRHRLPPPDGLDTARCSECNGVLEGVERVQVADAVPPYVLATAERFRRCAGCGRVYWPGTHGDEIHARFARVRHEMAGSR